MIVDFHQIPIFEGFRLQNFVRILRVFELTWKASSSEYLLLAVVVEVVVRTITLPNLLLFRWCTCLLVLFRLLLIALALIDDGQFMSVYGCTLFYYDLSSCTCFTVELQLWLKNIDIR